MNDPENRDALIGASGFVGSVLRRQRPFGHHFRSTNIADVDGRHFETVVCAAAPAQKWRANKEPEADARNLEALRRHLDRVRCDRFVLVSTVDVFKTPVAVDEASEVNLDGLHAYGLNRRRLETFVVERFPNATIVRLPGLVGPGLRKNVIFDLLNENNLSAVDSRAAFQFYPMINLWYDIEIALRAELRLVHLTAEPVSVREVAKDGFGVEFRNELGGAPASYDFRSRHAPLFGGTGDYQYSRRETIAAIRAYAQTDPVTIAATA